MIWLSSLRSKDVNATTCCHILCVMGDIAVHLNEETKERVVGRLSKGRDGGGLLREMMWLSLSDRLSAADLMSWLKTFTLPLEVISSAVETLYQFGCSEDIKQTQVRDIYTSAADVLYDSNEILFSETVVGLHPVWMTISQTQEQCNLVIFKQAVPKLLLKVWIRYDWRPLWVCLVFLSGFPEPALWGVDVCLRVIFGQHNPNWQWSSEPRRGADGENKLLADLSSLLQKCPYDCGRKVNFHFELMFSGVDTYSATRSILCCSLWNDS